MDHEITRARQLGWDLLTNGERVAAAERAGFDLIVTADQNLRDQQNLDDRVISIVVLSTNRWDVIGAKPRLIIDAASEARTGLFIAIDLASPR